MKLVPASLVAFLLICLVAGACTSQSTALPAEVNTEDLASDAASADTSGRTRSSMQTPLAADFTVSTGEASSFFLGDHRGEIVVLYFSSPG